MAYAELFIYTQTGCPHCKAVEPVIEDLKANFTNVSVINLSMGTLDDANHALARVFGIVRTPTAVIVEDEKPTLFEGEAPFASGNLRAAYQKAIANGTKKNTTLPGSNTTTRPGPPAIVDPGPDQESSSKKPLLIAAGILTVFILLK
ncbi:MAG TPA: thioredoxin family protein [Saprospiraceae bacterium]|nr:thioredoxin family protein [Saprospiraceae bacterium]